MAASSALLADRRATGLCPRDGKPAAPFVYCVDCRAYRTRASNESAARKAGRLPPKAPPTRTPVGAEDVDGILRAAAERGEAVLYTPPLRGQGHGFELVKL